MEGCIDYKRFLFFLFFKKKKLIHLANSLPVCKDLNTSSCPTSRTESTEARLSASGFEVVAVCLDSLSGQNCKFVSVAAKRELPGETVAASRCNTRVPLGRRRLQR